MTTPDDPMLPAAAGWRLALLRLGLGLGQGIALFLLHRATLDPDSAGHAPALAAAVLVAAWLPLCLLGGLGRMRPGTLLLWGVAVTAILAGLGLHGVLREEAAARAVAPGFALSVGSAALLFIAQALVTAGDQQRRLVAAYPLYFETAWWNGLRLALAGAFLGAFWLLLWIGVGLFAVIGIDLPRRVITEDWFAIPVSPVVFAAAVHLLDLRAGLTRGIRGVLLTLLAWLGPLMALIAAAFLLALPVTGLAPLWATRHATAMLLVAVAALVVLVNATCQDGRPENRPPAALRAAARLIGLVLPPLVGLAAWGLWLRIDQHGLTPERVLAAACLLVGACYAAGYALAALAPARWMAPLEATNILTAGVVVLLLLALLTPLGDPARLAVADQVRRLDRGHVTPEAFDTTFLRFEAGRYGLAALEELQARTEGPGAPVIAARAAAALRQQQRWMPPPPLDLSPEAMQARLPTFPAGRALPPAFLALPELRTHACLGATGRCEAVLLDLDTDGREEILLRLGLQVTVYRAGAGEGWTPAGTLALSCESDTVALREGRVATVPSPWRDLEIDGRRLRLVPPSSVCR